jgi:hypothetical protein
MLTAGCQNRLLRLPAVTDNSAMQTEPPKAEPPKRKRRWFQFSLRWLMIAVTLLAVPLGYVGWQAKIVRERRDEAERLANYPQVVHQLTSVTDRSGRLSEPFDKIDATRFEQYRPNWVRLGLGDMPIQVFDFERSKPSEYDHQRLLTLFPEATIAVNAVPVAKWLHEPATKP